MKKEYYVKKIWNIISFIDTVISVSQKIGITKKKIATLTTTMYGIWGLATGSEGPIFILMVLLVFGITIWILNGVIWIYHTKLQPALEAHFQEQSEKQPINNVIEQNESLPINIKLEDKPLTISHPERKNEYWDIFKIALYNNSTKPINNVNIELIDFYNEATKLTPHGFSRDMPFNITSKEIINTKAPQTISLISFKKRPSPYVSPDIYIGGVKSGNPDAELRNPAIMIINIKSLDYPDQIFSTIIRVHLIRNQNQNDFMPKVEILETELRSSSL